MVEPLQKIEVIGKSGGKKPFPITKHHGLYFFIRTKDFDRLREINETYRLTGQKDPKPLDDIKVVGRRGIAGRNPFLLPEHEETYLCILMEHLERLEEINRAYQMFLEAEKKELEEMKQKAFKAIEEAKRNVEEAENSEAARYAPELMRQVDKKIAELEVAFKSAEYQRAIDLTTMVRDLVKQTKEETLRIKETRKIEEAPPPEDGRYVYCIIPWGGSERRLSFGRIGIEDSGEAYTIPFGDLAVVVSNSPLKEYTPSEDNVLTHNQVIMLVMDRYPVLPMAFGMAFKNEETLKEVLGRIHDDLKKALTEVAGKVEFGVKVIQPKEAEFDEDAFASEIKVLRELAVQCKLGRRFSKRLVLNAFYLVSESSVMAFVSAVNTLQERFSQLKISCTGPWPPFNFVTIKVGRGDQNAVPH